MTDTNEALRLTDDQKFYLRTALQRLSSEYDENNEGTHASEVRRLLARAEALHTERVQPTAEAAGEWQTKLLACGGDHERARNVMLEQWHALCLTAIDPAGALVESLLPLIDQSRGAAAMQILMTIEKKIISVVRDPSTVDNRYGQQEIVKKILTFVRRGKGQLQQGEDLWTEDPHIGTGADISKLEESSQP